METIDFNEVIRDNIEVVGELLPESSLVKKGVNAGIVNILSGDNCIIDESGLTYNICLLFVYTRFTNQNGHVICINVRRYEGGLPIIKVSKIDGLNWNEPYGVQVIYKIEDGRTRVWVSGGGLVIGKGITKEYYKDSLPDDGVKVNLNNGIL